MIDPEATVIGILAAAGLEAVGEITEAQERPVIMVAAAGGVPASSSAPDWLMPSDLQLDVHGRTKVEAADYALLARAALLAAARTQPALTLELPAVIQSMSVNPPNWVPDETWPGAGGRPGPRYIILVTLSAHPHEEAS